MRVTCKHADIQESILIPVSELKEKRESEGKYVTFKSYHQYVLRVRPKIK